MESLIGKSYVPLDNSYALNLSSYNWDRNEYTGSQLAGNMVGLDPQRVIILSEPFVMVHNNEDRHYNMILVKDIKGDVYTVMFNPIGLTITDEELTERSEQRQNMIDSFSTFGYEDDPDYHETEVI